MRRWTQSTTSKSGCIWANSKCNSLRRFTPRAETTPVTCYRKGIQILETELSAMPEGDDKKMLLNRLCGAYCSIGELYMTDL